MGAIAPFGVVVMAIVTCYVSLNKPNCYVNLFTVIGTSGVAERVAKEDFS